MADVISSAITIISSSWTLAIRIRDLIVHIKNLDEDVQKLEEKAETLIVIVEEVKGAYGSKEDSGDRIYQITRKVVTLLEIDLASFSKELSRIKREKRTGQFRGSMLLQAWREHVAAPTFQRLEKSIKSHRASLHLVVDLLTRRDISAMRSAMRDEFRRLTELVLASTCALSPGIPLQRSDTGATLVESSEDKESEDQTSIAPESPTLLRQSLVQDFAALRNQLDWEQSLSITLPNTSPFGNQAPFPDAFGQTSRFQLSRRPSSPGPFLEEFSNPLVPKTSWRIELSRKSSTCRSERSLVDESPSSKTGSFKCGPAQSRTSSVTAVESVGLMAADQEYVIAKAGSVSKLDPKQREKGIQLLQAVHADRKDDSDAILHLLKKNVSLEELDDKRRTPLLHAAFAKRPKLVKTLLAFGANVRATDKDSKTALHLACMNGDVNVISLLLEGQVNKPRHACSIDIDATDKDGRTALHYGVQHDMADAAKLLVDCDANINVKDQAGGYTPYYYAIKRRYSGPIEVLKRKGAEPDAECHKLLKNFKKNDSIKKLVLASLVT